MAHDREGYITPVGFAREPAIELRRWIGRVMLGLLLILLLFIVVNNVISPPDDPLPVNPTEGPLPAPV